MKTTLSLFHFVLPASFDCKQDHRDIGVLRVIENNKVGYGEVSPLPDLSQESFSDISTLKNLSAPSISWGLECAKWNMQECEESSIPLCGLVLENESIEKAIAFEEAGYNVIKVKVGGDLKRDLQRIEAILKSSRRLKLRLDFNGRGEPNDLEVFFKNVPRDRIDYVEDPGSRDLQGFRIAVDEDVALFCDHEDVIKIIKPTKVGIDLPEYLWKKNKSFVVSSSFESNLGLFHLSKAAQKWGLKEVAHGLDTGKYFKTNIFDLQRVGGSLALPSNKWVREQMEVLLSHKSPIAERSL